MLESKFYRDYILYKNKTFLNTISNKYFEPNKFYFFFYSLLLNTKNYRYTVIYIWNTIDISNNVL